MRISSTTHLPNTRRNAPVWILIQRFRRCISIKTCGVNMTCFEDYLLIKCHLYAAGFVVYFPLAWRAHHCTFLFPPLRHHFGDIGFVGGEAVVGVPRIFLSRIVERAVVRTVNRN